MLSKTQPCEQEGEIKDNYTYSCQHAVLFPRDFPTIIRMLVRIWDMKPECQATANKNISLNLEIYKWYSLVPMH